MINKSKTRRVILENSLIVSCQAESGSAFNNKNSILAFSKEAELGGASGLRLKGEENIKYIRDNTNLPLIGLTKTIFNKTNYVNITPTFEDGVKLKNAGADYIALDATGRNGYVHMSRIREELDISIIGDLSNIGEAEKAAQYGCSFFSTALSGYTERYISSPFEGPDFDLLSLLINNFNVPVLAEGRYWTQDNIRKAFDLGAYAVVIGSAITRPRIITQYFLKSINK